MLNERRLTILLIFVSLFCCCSCNNIKFPRAYNLFVNFKDKFSFFLASKYCPCFIYSLQEKMPNDYVTVNVVIDLVWQFDCHCFLLHNILADMLVLQHDYKSSGWIEFSICLFAN